jgi:hypothetical protein
MFKPKVPSTPAAAAPAPEEKPKELKRQESASRTEAKTKRKGRSALRIDLQGGTAGADGTGINVPRA